MILYIDEILYSIAERKIKHLNEEKGFLSLCFKALLCSVSVFLLKCSVPVETSIFMQYLMGGAVNRHYRFLCLSLVKPLSVGRARQKTLQSASTRPFCSERCLVQGHGTQK